MSESVSRSFAGFGAEKMIYDARMGPVAVEDEGKIIIVYQGGEGELLGHPHLVSFDIVRRKWSAPMRVGTATKMDHHLCPIVWRDDAGFWHLLFNCHFSPGTHLISQHPHDTERFEPAPPIDVSISYPWIGRLKDGTTILVYRIEGHLGYWVYRLSGDGGATWCEARRLLDFNKDPLDEIDEWAGEYLSVEIGAKGLHMGFCHWDERQNAHPRYRFHRQLMARYHQYYLHLDPHRDRLTTVDGQEMEGPVNRREAEIAKVLDTGDELTNFPSIFRDEKDYAVMVAPITKDDPWRCDFNFFRWDGRQWNRSVITQTDNIWSASRFVRVKDREVIVDLICGEGKGEECFYGGGELQRWRSDDGGATWAMMQRFVPQPRLLFNNPRPVHRVGGGYLPDAFVMYGWAGPGGVWGLKEFATESCNRGKAWLWLDGKWA